MSTKFHIMAKETDVADGQHIEVKLEGLDLLLASVAGEYYVVRNQCTHAKEKLCGGIQKGFFLFCPKHAARFDLRDGSTKGKLTQTPLDTFETRVFNGNIEVNLAVAE